MKISFSQPPESMILSTGFGHAGFKITTSLQALGHQVPYRDSSAPVEVNFAHPNNWKWSSKDIYRIGYTPWESSIVPNDWKVPMLLCDELWTTSPILAQWLEPYYGKSVKVFEHGVDTNLWQRRKRNRRDKIKFLHIGEPAVRKAGQLAFDAFVEAFGDRDDVSLTIKAHHYNSIRTTGSRQPNYKRNVNLIANDCSDAELASIVQAHDVLVYPSYGEGFGLLPLQAMATGMPVICTSGWAPYKKYLPEGLRLNSVIADSPWPRMHPGKMFHPKKDHLVELYLEAFENFETYSSLSYRQAAEVKKKYDWVKLTEQAFAPVVQQFTD